MAQNSNFDATRFALTNPDGTVDHITIGGRDRWALECLIVAGIDGCTPIEKPGPRWSAYVHNLRNLGVDIETIHEKHGGPFSGTHARYVLRSRIEHVNRRGAA